MQYNPLQKEDHKKPWGTNIFIPQVEKNQGMQSVRKEWNVI